jgi:hypothetical protein
MNHSTITSERNMSKAISTVVFLSATIVAGAAAAQGILLDAASDKVIQKYQTATCDQLKAQKEQPERRSG